MSFARLCVNRHQASWRFVSHSLLWLSLSGMLPVNFICCHCTSTWQRSCSLDKNTETDWHKLTEQELMDTNTHTCICTHLERTDWAEWGYCCNFLVIILLFFFWFLNMQVSDDCTKIRRSPEKPLPDNTKERKDDIYARSVYVVSIGKF